MDEISLSPIVLLILIGIIAFAVIGCIVLAGKFRSFKSDLKLYCPEAPIFIQARQTGKPVLALHDAGSSFTRFLIGEINHRASWTFKAEEFEVKFRPDFSSHCEPDRYYGDLEVYHAATIHPVFFGAKSIIAINNIMDLLAKKESVEVTDENGKKKKVKVEPFKKLRFLPTNDLLALMKCNAQDLPGNCQMFLKEYSKKEVGQPLPGSVNEFVTLIQRATKEFNAMPLEGDPDAPNNYYYDTIESVKMEKTTSEQLKEMSKSIFDTFKEKYQEKQKDKPQKEKRKFTFPFLKKKSQPQEEEEQEAVAETPKQTKPTHVYEEDESPVPVYKLAIRHHWKLKGISYKAALMNVPITTFSQDVKSMEEMSREQGKMDKDKEENRTWMKIIGICAVLGVIIFGIIALFNVLK